MKLYCSWTSLKQIKETYQLDIYYYDITCYYEILIINGYTTWYTKIWQDCSKCAGINIEENNLNLSDFIDNFKTNAQKL